MEVDSRIRTRRRGPIVEEEEAEEGEDEDEDVNGHDDENEDDGIGNRLRKSSRIRTSPIKGQHPSHGLKFSNESSKVRLTVKQLSFDVETAWVYSYKLPIDI